MKAIFLLPLIAFAPTSVLAERIGPTQCRIITPDKVQDQGNTIYLRGPGYAHLKCPFTESMRGYTIYYYDEDGKAGAHSVKAWVQDVQFTNPGVNLDYRENFHSNCNFASNLKKTSEPAIGPANVPCPFTVTQGSFQHFHIELWSKVKAVARARFMGIETW